MKITLVGMPGSGKSTIAKQVAKQTGLRFIDADNYIENLYHSRISKIFDYVGEAGFREIEHVSLKKILTEEDDFILATGGGMPCFHNNMQLILENSISIYLKIDEDELFRRLHPSKKTRPLIQNMTNDELKSYIKKTLNNRKNYYRQAEYLYNFELDFLDFLNQNVLPFA